MRRHVLLRLVAASLYGLLLFGGSTNAADIDLDEVKLLNEIKTDLEPLKAANPALFQKVATEVAKAWQTAIDQGSKLPETPTDAEKLRRDTTMAVIGIVVREVSDATAQSKWTNTYNQFSQKLSANIANFDPNKKDDFVRLYRKGLEALNIVAGVAATPSASAVSAPPPEGRIDENLSALEARIAERLKSFKSTTPGFSELCLKLARDLEETLATPPSTTSAATLPTLARDKVTASINAHLKDPQIRDEWLRRYNILLTGLQSSTDLKFNPNSDPDWRRALTMGVSVLRTAAASSDDATPADIAERVKQTLEQTGVFKFEKRMDVAIPAIVDALKKLVNSAAQTPPASYESYKSATKQAFDAAVEKDVKGEEARKRWREAYQSFEMQVEASKRFGGKTVTDWEHAVVAVIKGLEQAGGYFESEWTKGAQDNLANRRPAGMESGGEGNYYEPRRSHHWFLGRGLMEMQINSLRTRSSAYRYRAFTDRPYSSRYYYIER